MGKRDIKLLPKARRILDVLGENVKMARLRRKLSAAQVAERANISRPTLTAIEKGAESVRIGSILRVLIVLGLEKDLLQIAKDDLLGRKIQDAGLLTKERAPKRKSKDES